MSALAAVDVARVGAVFVFFFNDTATTEIYTLSLHDALPIWAARPRRSRPRRPPRAGRSGPRRSPARCGRCAGRSEEHTSELQSHDNLVCRLLLEKKKKAPTTYTRSPTTTSH